MKKLIYSLVSIAFLATFGVSSCSKDETTNVPATGGYIKAKVDGKTFTTVNTPGGTTIVTGGGIGSYHQFQIIGSYLDGSNVKTISLSITGANGVGTYQFSTNLVNGPLVICNYALSNASGSNNEIYLTNSCAGVNGTIQITKWDDKTVEGTFSFTAKTEDCNKTVNVKDGEFRGEFI